MFFNLLQHGLDRTACSGALRILESQQISMNHNYAPARFYPPTEDNRTRKTSWNQGNNCVKLSSNQTSQQPPPPNQELMQIESSSIASNSIKSSRQRRPTSILPLGLAYSSLVKKEPSANDHPKVVLTPESPHSKIPRTLYDPNGNEDSGLSMFGTTSTISATCIDIDMQSLSSSSSSSLASSSTSSIEDPECATAANPSSAAAVDPAAICSVSTATYCQGNFQLMDRNGQSLVSSAFSRLNMATTGTASSSTATSTTSTLPKMSVMDNVPPVTNFILTSPIVQNPYRKIFEQRKEFYERFSTCTTLSETSSIKSGWQRIQQSASAALPSRMMTNDKQDVFTVKTNIEPFGPFVIEHNVKAPGPGRLKSDQMICLNPDDQDELRYATSHSGDGVESHLEVSLGKDGSIIKTRHHRLDGIQNSEENSILKLQYGEGGKVLEIQQTQSVVVPRRRPQSPRRHSHLRPNSAYCTHVGSIPHFLVPRYNSMPNLDGRRRINAANSELGFNTHPADEEKRLAYTRGTLKKKIMQC